MKKNVCLPVFFLFSCFCSFAQLSVTHLRTDNLDNPLGIDDTKPLLGWQLASSERNVMQTAYELRVNGEPGGKAPLWNSGKTSSAQSIQIAYAGPDLLPGKRYYWQVRVWDNHGHSSAWSETAWWQTGLLTAANWKASWIGPDMDEVPSRPSPLLRREFDAGSGIARATAYITAHGLYEAQLNGHRIGDAVLTPGWTSYNRRLQYQAYDVTSLLQKGRNAVGVTLANGWYRGHIGYDWQTNVYGKDISLLFQLVITYRDGHTDTVASDQQWRSATGPVRTAELYDGETYDAREERTGWTKAGFDDAGWNGVLVKSYSLSNLVATTNQPIRAQETFPAVRVFTTPAGEQVIDFGQNLVGWVQVQVDGKAGDEIIISHAEVLDRQGNFYTENLRRAKATDTFVCKGGGGESFQPHFTFHGFRYIRVKGFPGTLDPARFKAVAIYSDMAKTGSFQCSNPLINQLQHNIQWGQRGNFLDVPTDCPQRDERLGWTGDAQVFSRTAAYNMDVEAFFSKWLKDVAADQLPNGAVPFVIPNITGRGASAGWADVATIVPWNCYLAYGDRRILEQQYPSMRAWVEYMHEQSRNDLWNTGFHFGDWLFYRPFDDNDGRSAVTDKYLIAQCFYAHSTQLLINAANVLGRKDDAALYESLLKKIKAAFIREYMTSSGRLVSGTQTAYVLALEFDMLPENLREQAANRLVENVKAYRDHLTTGFLGTPYLCHVLSRFGHTDVAYRLLLQDDYPSWLYPVKMGATTIWERWDGIQPDDSSFQTPGMNSFNHYAYGAIGDWMYRVVAGIDTYEDGPGYKHIAIAPHPGGDLTDVSASLASPYGVIRSQWKKTGDTLRLDVTIPANTVSTIHVPMEDGYLVTVNGQPLANNKDIHVESVARGYLLCSAGSGEWHFSIAP